MPIGESLLFMVGKIITMMMNAYIVILKRKIKNGTSKKNALVWFIN